jgi:hypothetical protein
MNATRPGSVLRLAGASLVLVVASACVGSGATFPAGATPTPSPTSGGGAPSPTPSGFYLRGWKTQALAPQYTFTWISSVTVSDGRYFSGNVAVPAIYPGPLYVGLSYRPISETGMAAIVAEARADGLLGTTTTFGQSLPGGISCHLKFVVQGVTYEPTGTCPPGSSATSAGSVLFAAFWNKATSLDSWLDSEMGKSVSYAPERLAVLAITPADVQSGITPSEKAWPLAPFASWGTAAGNVAYRCGVVSGSDLATLLPIVQASNAITRFIDTAGTKKTLLLRVLTPGETAPC